MTDALRESALDYHRAHPAGKIAMIATKPLANQRDLALAYSPGVAAACDAIKADPKEAVHLTARGNLVAVITNGTAVLGLGAIGPLASKPVMEGKAVLFKKFAGIDSFDIEIDERDPARLVEIIAALEPTFGAINLEDIKAPECFEVETRLRERMRIPVFHDDQHGTAIIVAAAVLNALALQDKRIEAVTLCCCGAGAAAIACLNLLVELGLRREHVIVVDVEGVVYEGRRELMDPFKERFAQATAKRTLAEAIAGVDVFLGVSAPGIVTRPMVATMADRPLIMALANPVPEIMPEEARAAKPDAIIATGRSDFPNQVNNVLCFPYIFRGALDCGATTINEAMKTACAQAIAWVARATAPETVAAAYGLTSLSFGPDCIIPKPFDSRLAVELPIAVARAAMDSGVAERPIEDFEAYRQRLSTFVFRSGLTMRPIFERAREDPRRVVFSDGEEPRVLRAIEVLVQDGIARPIVIGRPDVIEARLDRLGLSYRLDQDVTVCNPESDPRYNDYVDHYLERVGRAGITPDVAREVVRTRSAVIGSLMVDRGEADALIAGPTGSFQRNVHYIRSVIGLRRDAHDYSTVHLLILDRGLLFLADTEVSVEPPAEEVCETACMAAEVVRRFGLTPKIALLSHSNFGSLDTPSARKMRDALALIQARQPELEVDGEMHGDTALSETIRARILPGSRLSGEANLLIFPDLDAANIAYNLLRTVTGTVAVGPILVGPRKPVHVVTPSITARGIVNLTALAAVDAQMQDG
jgi:malate dehydrogenase (oxaloacetate-decarboxylating)(NADP+)